MPGSTTRRSPRDFGDVSSTPLNGSAADFDKLFVGDTEKWDKVMKAGNIRQE